MKPKSIDTLLRLAQEKDGSLRLLPGERAELQAYLDTVNAVYLLSLEESDAARDAQAAEEANVSAK